ncbi:MAG TPA: hypothetical protein PK639_04670 [Candidatus Woesebacteria bacterium]|nr:hypothetical protein [Candidatus Woesebacteria bacterium]
MLNQIKNKLSYLALVAPVFAAESIDISPKGNFAQLGNITANSLVSGAISLVLLVVALVFFFILVLGGLRWIMSEGDQKAVEAARGQITNALIGLAIVFSAFAIIKLIEALFGINLFKLEFKPLY